MATQTYTYFQPDASNLRPAYGGDAILDGGDSAEIDPLSLTERYIARELGYTGSGTSFSFEWGDDSSNNIWAKVSDNLYSSISTYLSTSELASATATAPTGYGATSRIPYFMPKVGKKNLIVIGDSLSAGVSSTNAFADAPSKQALDLIQTALEYDREPSERGWYNDTWALSNTALGSSSWGNTDAAGGVAVYPQRFDLAFDQRFRTLSLNGTATSFLHVWLGTNDISYDTDLTGAQVWARAETAIGQLRTEFPTVPIILGTPIRRSESSTLNGRLEDYRDEMLANYLTAGANYIVRYDLANAVFNLSTGDSTDTTYYAGDEVHLTTAGYGQCAASLRDLLITL